MTREMRKTSQDCKTALTLQYQTLFLSIFVFFGFLSFCLFAFLSFCLFVFLSFFSFCLFVFLSFCLLLLLMMRRRLLEDGEGVVGHVTDSRDNATLSI